MCRFKSYIVTKDLKIHGSRKTCSHEDIMQELKLEDGKEQNAILMREHVKIEVTPKNDKAMTRNLADWTYKEDEPGALPEWYKNNKNRIEEAVFLQLSEDLKIQLVLDGDASKCGDHGQGRTCTFNGACYYKTDEAKRLLKPLHNDSKGAS